MDFQENAVAIITTAIIGIIILYFLISGAVSSGTKEQTKLLKKQNDILLKMLNEQGVDKQELLDVFVAEKTDLWPTMKSGKRLKE
jgi:hypothetical protein